MEIPIQIGIHGKLSLGVFHITNHQLDIPAIIVMCYGLNGDRVEQHRMSVTAGRSASQNRINFVRMDYCNQGVSQGTFVNVTISSKIDDFQHLISELCSYFCGQNINIYLIGFSDGARIAANIADLERNIRGLILWNPIITIPGSKDQPSNPNKVNEKLYVDKFTKKVYKDILGVKLNTSAMREMKDDNTFKMLMNRNYPILYIFGSEDRFTQLIQKNIQDSEIYKAEMDSIHVINGAHHIFSSSHFEKEVIDTTINWIKQRKSI